MAKNRRYMMDEDFDEKDRIDDNDIDDYYVQEAPVREAEKVIRINAQREL